MLDAEDEPTHRVEMDEPSWSLHPGLPGTRGLRGPKWAKGRDQWAAVGLTTFSAQEAHYLG